MIGRADIEGSKSNVALNAWPPQASYPCGNFSDTSGFNILNPCAEPKDRKATLARFGLVLKVAASAAPLACSSARDFCST